MMRKIRYPALLAGLAGLAAAATILTAPDAMADALSSCAHAGTATVCEGQFTTSPQDPIFDTRHSEIR
jgi:hypothetical protein